MFAMVWLAVVIGVLAAICLRNARPASGRADTPASVSKPRTRRLPPRPLPTAPHSRCDGDRVLANLHAASRGVMPIRPHHRSRVLRRSAVSRDVRVRPAAPMLAVPVMAASGRAATARSASG